MRETCLGFFNIKEFYQSCNFGCFWWIFLNIRPTYNTYQNLCMTFTNILVLVLPFSTSWKSCVKEQLSKKSLFGNFYKTSWLVTPGQKEGGVSFGPWNHDRWLSQQRSHKFEYVFCCWWRNQELKQETVKVELLKPTTPKKCIFMSFLDTNSHLSTKPWNFDIKSQSNS